MYLPLIYNIGDNNEEEDTTNKLLKILPKTRFI